MATTAYAYQVVSTSDPATAPLGQLFLVNAMLGDGEPEYRWPRFVENDGRLRFETRFTCKYLGQVTGRTQTQKAQQLIALAGKGAA